MAELAVPVVSGLVDAGSKPVMQTKYLDRAVLPQIEKEMSLEAVLNQSKKMLMAMDLLKPGQSVEAVGEFANEKTKVKIVGEGSEKATAVEFSYLHTRYRKLEKAALASRQEERNEIEVTVAKHLGKSLSEMGIKFVDSGENYLRKTVEVDVWKKKDGKPVTERVLASKIVESLQVEKISYFQAIKNLKKVYGSTKLANEKYINQMALGKVFNKSFEVAREHSETIAKQAEVLDSVPDKEKGFWHKVKRATVAIKKSLDKPLSPVAATAKALTGLALYDYNPVKVAMDKYGNPVKKVWAEIPISSDILPKIGVKLGRKFPKMKKLQELKDVTMREAAARLEEKLMVDPLTGEGVRTGAITEDQIREASVEGAKWALKMQVLPSLMAKLPGFSAFTPGEIYSMLRSSKMVQGGAKSVEAFVKKFGEAKTVGEKAKLTAWALGSGVGFYAAEKLSPVIGGAINPVLMGDIALMRMVGEVDKYAGGNSLEKTEMAETLKTVEEAITVSFAADSAVSVGERVVTFAETGSTNPLENITDENSLIEMVNKNPEYLQGELGGVFGEIRRAEHELIQDIKGIEQEDNPWQTYSFEPGVVYHVDLGSDDREPSVIKQDSEGRVFEHRGDEWIEVVANVTPDEVVVGTDTGTQAIVMSESEKLDHKTQAVHDYVYFEPDTDKMAFRMDLVPGETWESKVARLFEGYGEGGIDDPTGPKYLEGKAVQAMTENSPELRALTGEDGVYESQIHQMLIQRLLTDAASNGLVYDQATVQQRMVEFLKSDTTADADTVEGELDYGELYQHLFVGSQVTKDVASIDTEVYQPYFLSGNEGTDHGIEVNIVIPEGGTVLGQLAEQGYGSGDGQIYDAQSNVLPDAEIIRINDDGTESIVEDFEELDHVQPGDKFVVRTGVGDEISAAEGKIPEIVPMSESNLASFELAPTADQQMVEKADWEDEVVRNEAGEIYVGTVHEGDIFSQMMIERFDQAMDNPWDLLPAIQNMEANGLEIYAENITPDGDVVRRSLNSYDDLGTLYVGERVVIVDPHHVLSEIPDQRGEIDLDNDSHSEDKEDRDGVITTTPSIIPGFDEDGKLDLNNPPDEAIRDSEGYIYLGEIKDGVYISMLVSSNLPRNAGGDTWQYINELYESDQIEILKADENGNVQAIQDINLVNIGDKIVIRDQAQIIEGVRNIAELVEPSVDLPIETIVKPASEDLAVEEIKSEVERVISELGEDVHIGLTIIDLDNEQNAIRIGSQESFNASEIQKVALAMAVLRAVDAGSLDLEAESRFVVLPGDYKPSLEHLLNLMLVHNDPVARDGLLKELVGQDMDKLLGEDTGLVEVLHDNVTTTDEVAKLYQTLFRTTYLSDESRDLIKAMMGRGQDQYGGLLEADLVTMGNVEVVEFSRDADWAGIAGGAEVPEYSTFANVTTSDGRDLVVVLTTDSTDQDISRSAFRTVARDLMGEIDTEAEILTSNELKADIAKTVFDSEQAKLDYVSHVIAPYRMEDGTYVLDPLIQTEAGEIAGLDLSHLQRQVTTYVDGSGVIQLVDPQTQRVVSIFVNDDQHVAMVFDSQELAERAVNYEVYASSVERSNFVGETFSPDSDQITVEVSLETTGGIQLDSASDRTIFVDHLRESGKDYDFYVFVGGDQSTIMYARDGERVDLGTVPANVSVAIVSSADNELDSNQAQETWKLLLDKLGSTKDVTDVVWHEQTTSYSVADDTWDPQLEHWFSNFNEISNLEITANQQDASPETDTMIFSQIVSDLYQVQLPSSATTAMVDGINFSIAIYIPEGMTLDYAVIARSNNIDYNSLVVRPTNDANVYLIGERIASDQQTNPDVQASYTHPTGELLYQYEDGTLSEAFTTDVDNPLVSVFPLERPLDTYLDTDKLIRIDKNVAVKLQYQGEPYFVLSDEGVRDQVYVDPYTMVSYVQSGKDFIPLVLDGYDYQTMAEIYGLDSVEAHRIGDIWERRLTDAVVQEARNHGVKVVNEAGQLVLYTGAENNRDDVFKIKHDEHGVVMVNDEGKIVLENQNGDLLTYNQGQFVLNSAQTTQSLDTYLQGYSAVTNDAGVPMQYRGFPILSKGDLIYLISQNGVTLVGSRAEIALQGAVADPGVKTLLYAWNITENTADDLQPDNFGDYPTDVGKMIHGLAIQSERLLEISNGVVDLETGQTYLLKDQNAQAVLELGSGKLVLANQETGDLFVWGGEEWESVSFSEVVTKEQYLESAGLHLAEDAYDRGMVIDRRTQSPVYTKDNWAYILDGNGLIRIGQFDSVMKAGFVGYLDGDNHFQTYTPDSINEIYGNPTYTVAERISLLMNPVVNAVVGLHADMANVFADFELKNVLPTVKKEHYVDYDALPPQYLAALISQENKTLYRQSEGEAENLDFGVLVKVLLSGGDRGGSTLVQGMVKNLLISPEERMERSLSRKITEVWMADQVLETMIVEEVVEMYANTVSYGSIDGREIIGIAEAAEVLFGKHVQDLDLVETGLLIAVPNYPNRNNLYAHDNAVGWADSASGVYRHMYENGFITEAEMEQAFLDVHSHVLPSGSLEEIELLIKSGVLDPAERDWAVAAMNYYHQMNFEQRKLDVETVGNEAIKQYADFYTYLHILDSSKVSAEELVVGYQDYFWYGKTLSDAVEVSPTDYLVIDGDITPPNLGVEYTTRVYKPGEDDYTPRVEIDQDHNVSIDAWSHRYEAIAKDEAGNPITYNVVVEGKDGLGAIVQDNEGKLWRVESDGLVRVPGRVYQIEGGGVVQAMPANDREGLLIDISGAATSGAQYVRDEQGNYFRVIEGSNVVYVGRVMPSNAGQNVLYELDAHPRDQFVQSPQDFLKAAVENMLSYRATEVQLSADTMQVSSDPNIGYVQPRGPGEYGLVNPLGAQTYLEAQGIDSQPIELSARGNGQVVFEKYLTSLVEQDKSVLVWLNSDLATDVENIGKDGEVKYEAISRYEKPVSVLQIFEFDGLKYVVYQDPTQAAPVVVTFDRFAELASPSTAHRYKTLVIGEYALDEELKAYLYNPSDPVNQVGLLVDDGYVYNYESPTAVEGMMSINPEMQAFVTEEARKLLEENGGNGFVGMAMDESGRMPFYVSLNADGEPDPELATRTYQPGSIYKLVTSMWALQNGVDPNAYYEAGDYYQWAEGDKTFNWTMDPITGALKYSMGASASMTMLEGLRQSNNPYFINLLTSASDYTQFARYANSVGFGDEMGLGNVPSGESIVPDPQSDLYTERDIAYTAIGQGPVAVAPLEMLTFVSAIANNGAVIEPFLSQEIARQENMQLPNQASDYVVMAEAMRQVTSDPSGTAYEVFHDVQGYDVYGKTGTAEVGGDERPNAFFTGYAIDQATGEKITFIFLIPNGGEGSHVAAPIARLVLDQYFADLQAHKALEAGSEVVQAIPSGSNPTVIPTPNIVDISEVEQGVDNFRLEDQPNKELIVLATEATRIANEFVPSRNDLSIQVEGAEFVQYLKDELSKAGYAELVQSPQMTSAFDMLLNDYKTYGGVDPSERESVQCVAWEVFLAQTRGLLTGAPVVMSIPGGDADDVVSEVLSRDLRTGASSPWGGVVVRFAEDRAQISLMEPGDSVYVKYPGEEDLGHALVILAKAVNIDNEPMVLVSDANRYVDENGSVVTDGKLRLRWLTQDEFSRQYEREGDRNLGQAPSQVVVIRPQLEEQVRTILDQYYHGSLPVETDWVHSTVPTWQFVPDDQGNLRLPFENSVVLQTENVGEMRPIESIYIHWSGASSTDPSTWTAGMVENGLVGEETSSTFAVGIDTILQMAQLSPTHVQETYATPWQHGAINIEIAGEDFDNNPPSKEQYQKVVDLVTELLISANKPVSIVKPHYSEIYMWSENMPNRLGEVGNWMILDSRDLTVAKYWDEQRGSWIPLDQATYTYDLATVQSKDDPGEQFFAQLTQDVKQRLIALGRSDLAETQFGSENTPLLPEDIPVRMIDKENPITREEIETEIVPNLVSVDTVNPVLAEAAIGEDILLQASMMPDLIDMIVASRSANISLYLSSGYRSFGDQLSTLLESGNDESLVMLPGRSQHHSGMAIDFTSGEIGYVVDIEAGFENTETGKWLVENGWKYGFVQAYTKNHDGVENEPWHYYYVGKEIAKIWHDSQLTEEPKDIFEILEQLGPSEP